MLLLLGKKEDGSIVLGVQGRTYRELYETLERLRLFRYKTLLKRYLKRLNNIVSDISLIYVTLLLLSGTLVLSIFFPPAFIIRHILLFASPIEQYPVMAVILKTIGIFYTGLLINKIWLIIQHYYERFKKE